MNTKDRKYQFWERNALSIQIWSEKALKQKLNYIHENPVRAGICNQPEEYFYSSAGYYNGDDYHDESGQKQKDYNRFPFLTHFDC